MKKKKQVTKKDSPKVWFKAKEYGWGWYPCSKEGWAVMLLFASAVAFNFFRIDLQAESIGQTLMFFIPETIVILGLFILICYLNGEKPHWQWGEKKVLKKKSKKK